MKQIKLILLIILLYSIQLFAQFSGGSGTSGSPYLVSNFTDLGNMYTQPTKHFKMTNSIDGGNSVLTPTGTAAAPFTGSFDGQGFTISNVVIGVVASTTNKYWGIFGVTSGATIRNFSVESCSISIHDVSSIYSPYQEYYTLVQEYNIGMVSGRSDNTTFSSIIINNPIVWVVTDKCNYISTQGAFNLYQGTMVGYLSGGSISNCVVNNCISTNTNSFTGCPYYPVGNTYIGGFLGYCSGTVSQCNVSVKFALGDGNPTNIYVAGMIAYHASGTANNSYAMVKTNNSSWTPSNSSPNRYGIVNYDGFSGTGSGNTVNCYSILTKYTMGVDSHTRYGYFNSSSHTGTTSSCVTTSQALTESGANYNQYKGNYGGTITNSDTLTMKNIGLWQGKSYDMINIWSMSSAKNNGYPYLKNNGAITTGYAPGVPTLWQPANGEVNVSVTYYPFSFSASNALSYRYEIYTMGDVLVTSGYTTANQVGVANQLDYSTQYKWKVLAINNVGQTSSGYSYFTTGAFVGTLPAPVLTYPSADTTSMSLPYNFRWNTSAGATKYDLKIFNTVSGELFYSSLNQTDHNKSVTGTLENGVRYKWQVRGKSTTDSSAWAMRYFTATLTAPGTVVLVTPNNNDTTVVINTTKLIWHKVSGATSYIIQAVDSVSTSTPITVASVAYPDTSTTILKTQGFVNKTWYKWRVKAHNSAGDGSYSNYRKFKTLRTSGDTGAQPELPHLGLVPLCLGGEGGDITSPVRNTLTWHYEKWDIASETLVRPIMFSRGKVNRNRDTLYVPTSNASYDILKFPVDSTGFFNDFTNGVWQPSNTQWQKNGTSTNLINEGNYTNMGQQIYSASQPYAGGGIQLTDSTWFYTAMEDYNYYLRPVIIEFNKGVATRRTSTVFPQYQSNMTQCEKPILLNDSLIVLGVQKELVQSTTWWTESFIVVYNRNKNSWKKQTFKYNQAAPVGSKLRDVDVIGGFFQIDTTLYIYTTSQNMYNSNPNDNVKIWKILPHGLSKILSNSTFGDTLNSTLDYTLAFSSKIGFAGTADTSTSVIVNHWVDRNDCWWFFHTYDRINNTSKIWKFNGSSVTPVTLPNNTLKLSGAWMNSVGTDMIMIFQNWTAYNGGTASTGYRIHMLTGVVDTLNIPNNAADNDDYGFFNYVDWIQGKLYLTHKRSPYGFWGSNIFGSYSPTTNRIWYANYDLSVRIAPRIRSDEWIKIRGINPKATKKASGVYKAGSDISVP